VEQELARQGTTVSCVRRILLVLAVLAVPAFAPATAHADFKRGSYDGTTNQGFRVTFEASRKAVTEFRFNARAQCKDGRVFRRPGGFRLEKMKLAKNGRFDGRFVTKTNGRRVEINVIARLKGGRATGGLRLEATLPDGTRCDSNGFTGKPVSLEAEHVLDEGAY